jgi:hypothetical protein
LDAVKKSKATWSGNRTAFQKNFFQQVATLVVRQSRLTIADKATFMIRVASNALNAVAVGAIGWFLFHPPLTNQRTDRPAMPPGLLLPVAPYSSSSCECGKPDTRLTATGILSSSAMEKLQRYVIC